jgi:proteic killer suppression protein
VERGQQQEDRQQAAQTHLVRLDRLHAATTTRELDLPGFDCHALKGHQPTRYSIHVNGPWCLTFEFEEGDAQRVDFEQYH